MKSLRFSFSSILLAALVVPVIMTYQIFPGDTNFIQFGLIFLCLFLTFLLDILPLSEKKYYFYKNSLFWATLALAVGGAFVSAIVVRHKVAPVFQIHDIILQLEAAIRFFLDGINPWSATYHNTFMAAWHYSDTATNPALYHFVMMPFYLLFSLPFYYISNHTIGYFDGRIPLYVLYISMLVMTFRLVKDKEQRLIFTTIMALNPAMFSYILEGRSDINMFAFLLGGLILLAKKRFFLSGVLIALSFAIKQSVWPMLPLYFAYIYFNSKSLAETFKRVTPFLITFLVIVIPFLAWNPEAFLNSTVLYLSGNTVHSYPISGYGLGSLLYQLGVIKDLNAAYPFVIWQVFVITPILLFGVKLLKKYPSVKMLLFTYGILSFVYWYMSRYFNNSHMGYLTLVFIAAYFFPDSTDDSKEPKKPKD